LRGQPDIRPYRGKHPQIAVSAYIDPAAVIIGNVVIGEDSSVWPGSVIRGDVHYIRIGARTNIQDGCVLHVMRDECPLVLGDNVTVGHAVTLHGCVIESRCLIGMGAIILNGATIGAGSIVAAGTLITESTVIPAGSLGHGLAGQSEAHADGNRSGFDRRLCASVTSSTKISIARNPQSERRRNQKRRKAAQVSSHPRYTRSAAAGDGAVESR